MSRMVTDKISEDQIEFMRADIESGFAYTKIIIAARKKLEKEGRNFDEEFEQWKRRNKNGN